MSLNPDVAVFLDLLQEGREAGRSQPFHEMTPDQARAEFERASQGLDWPGPAGVTWQAFSGASRDGDQLRLRLYRPASNATTTSLPVVVYLHGGGFMVGSLDSHAAICRELAGRVGCAVLAVSYRLAPEYPFPTAVHDAEDALGWLAREGAALQLDTARLILAGDSAGATLATVLASAPERLPLRPCLQALFYPITDASRVSGSAQLFDEGYLLETATLEWFYQHYARTAEDRLAPRFSPLLRPDLAGATPTLLAIGGFDPLLDECLAYAERLAQAGVAVTTLRLGGLPHDFLRLYTLSEEVERLYQQIAECFTRAFAPLTPCA
jgi:acetyl esterase